MFEFSGATQQETDGPSFLLHAVAATKAADQVSAETYVVLSYDGIGETLMLDTTDAGQIKIVAGGLGADDPDVASSVDEFLDGMLQDTFAATLKAASATVRYSQAGKPARQAA
ncbi:MAG: hypothetical protein MEQ74_02600 [Paracoccus sp.]|nr:hypothetical protein [Paracoccus sp. (in: a-proteobacteria)]